MSSCMSALTHHSHIFTNRIKACWSLPAPLLEEGVSAVNIKPYDGMSICTAEWRPCCVQLIYSGAQKELFYTDSNCKQAYRNYVNMLLQRTNTYTGIQYKNDPTIFSFELMVRVGPCSLIIGGLQGHVFDHVSPAFRGTGKMHGCRQFCMHRHPQVAGSSLSSSIAGY